MIVGYLVAPKGTDISKILDTVDELGSGSCIYDTHEDAKEASEEQAAWYGSPPPIYRVVLEEVK